MMDSLHVLFSDEGHPVAIRKWSKEPFEGGEEYVRKSDLADLIAAGEALLDWARRELMWQPIETAPTKVGTDFLAINYNEPSAPELIYYDDEGYMIWDTARLIDIDDYTHWRPILDTEPGHLPEPLESFAEALKRVRGE